METKSNKTGTSKVGAISKAQKAQSFLNEKKLRKRRIVPKNEKGEHLGFFNIYSVAKYQKIQKGDSFETFKIFEKKRTVPKKN